jgi:hypothetical protein
VVIVVQRQVIELEGFRSKVVTYLASVASTTSIGKSEKTSQMYQYFDYLFKDGVTG